MDWLGGRETTGRVCRLLYPVTVTRDLSRILRVAADGFLRPFAVVSGLIRTPCGRDGTQDGALPLRERAARSRLQIPLEAARHARVRELDRYDDTPGTLQGRETGRSVVVPLEALLNVARQARVVALRIALALEDVDEASVGHADPDGRTWAKC